MSFIPNGTPLINEINIPGTHDSAMYFTTLGTLAKTQDMDIKQQLEMGIRYFDIRTRYVKLVGHQWGLKGISSKIDSIFDVLLSMFV